MFYTNKCITSFHEISVNAQPLSLPIVEELAAHLRTKETHFGILRLRLKQKHLDFQLPLLLLSGEIPDDDQA